MPAALDGAELVSHCNRVAAAALLIRYWPAKGNRHELSLALGGVLARAGWDVASTETFVAVVAHAANDPRPEDRVRCAHDAAENVAAEEPAFGYPKLKEILGDVVAARLADWLGLANAGGNARSGHVIRLTVDLTAAAEAAERAMHGAGLPLYRRGAMLVRPLVLDAHTFGGGRAKTIGLIAVPTILLRSYMGQAAVSAMCLRALRITVLKSAGNFTRGECHDLSAEKIQRVKCFMFMRYGIVARQQFSNAGAAGCVRKFQAVVNASFIDRLSHAVDALEKRIQQNRPWKVVTVRRGLKEDPDAALDRHFAAHPEDRGANIVLFEFYDEEGTDENQDCYSPARPACEEP